MAKVLMFHRILPESLIKSPNAYSTFGTLISQEYFETILSELNKNNFRYSTISNLAKQENDDKLVALTFDDGYSDNYEFAMPLLQKYKATATFFPVVNPCKNHSALPLDIYYQCVDEMDLSESERAEYITGQTKRKFYWAQPDKQMEIIHLLSGKSQINCKVGYMSAEQLKQLSDHGFEIGSHGMSHSLLLADYMSQEMIISELYDSKVWLQQITGKEVSAYCFPSGRYNSKLIELAKHVGYTSTCLVYRNENEKEVIPSYDRIFVKPNSLDELKKELGIK